MSESGKRRSIYFPSELLGEIEDMADEEQRSLSNMVCVLAGEGLSHRREQIRRVARALKEEQPGYHPGGDAD